MNLFEQNVQRIIERMNIRTAQDVIDQIVEGKYESDLADASYFTPDVIRLLADFYYVDSMLLSYFLSTQFKDIDINIVRQFSDFIDDDLVWRFLNYNLVAEVEQMKRDNPKFWNEFLKKKYEENRMELEQSRTEWCGLIANGVKDEQI